MRHLVGAASTMMMTMTPAERAAGRFMRAPDGHPVDAAPAAPAPADAEASAPIDTIDGDATALGDAAPPEAEGEKPGADPAAKTEGKPADGEGEKGEDQPAGAPEAYELKAPEGMDFDTEAMALAEPVLRELNLDNAQAQKLVDAYSQIVPKIGERIQAQQAADIAAQRKAWVEEARADPEIGGANWDASIAASAKALDQLGAPKGSPFRDLLNVSGLGNHPEMIRMFAKVGKAIGEDPVFISANTAAPKTREEKYYGSRT